MAKGNNPSAEYNRAEHIGEENNENIEAKRVANYGYDTDNTQWRRLKVDSDGKLETTATFSGSVNAVTEYDDGSSTVATPTAPGLVFNDNGTIKFVSDTDPLPVDATVNANVDLGDKDIGNATSDTQRVVIASDQPVLSVDDNGGSLTVDGTVTANLSATDNAVLDSIDTAVNGTLTVDASGTAVPITDNGGSVTVDASSLPLPTGASTSAKQDTIIGHIDGIESTLSTIESNQLADGHNVTIDNASIPVTDNGGSLTVDGTVGVSGTVTVDGSGSTQPVSASNLPLPTGAATSSKQDDTIAEINKMVGFEIGDYDYIALTYVASGDGAGEIETVTYKTGGSGGTTVATLTLGYDGSDRLTSVTKS